MNGVLKLGLLMVLSAANGGEMRSKSTPEQDGTSAVKLDWTNDLPPESSPGDYLVELQRRIAKGPVVRVRAIVLRGVVALESRNRGGLGGVHVEGTSLRIASPVKYKGLELVIHHGKPPGEDSCWRATGCALDFDLYERYLEARQARVQHIGFLYDRDLKNLKLGPPVAPKEATPAVR